jgi:hypothetical protein
MADASTVSTTIERKENDAACWPGLVGEGIPIGSYGQGVSRRRTWDLRQMTLQSEERSGRAWIWPTARPLLWFLLVWMSSRHSSPGLASAAAGIVAGDVGVSLFLAFLDLPENILAANWVVLVNVGLVVAAAVATPLPAILTQPDNLGFGAITALAMAISRIAAWNIKRNLEI